LQNVLPQIATTNNPKYGDYQCNNAMPLFAKFKGQADAPFKNPREVAAAIQAALPASPLIVETSIAGPGFINAKVSSKWIASELQTLLVAGPQIWAPPVPGGRRKVVIDFSSPNIAKVHSTARPRFTMWMCPCHTHRPCARVFTQPGCTLAC